MTAHFLWFGSGTSIRSGWIKLVLWAQTSSLNDMRRSCKCFPHYRWRHMVLGIRYWELDFGLKVVCLIFKMVEAILSRTNIMITSVSWRLNISCIIFKVIVFLKRTLFALLYVWVRILFTCVHLTHKYIHDRSLFMAWFWYFNKKWMH
jgi:hypothetical protein